MNKNILKSGYEYSYKVTLNPEKDAWNWYEGCNSEGFGIDWKKRVSHDIYSQINGKSKKESMRFLIPFLEQKYIEEKQDINSHIIFLENTFRKKFNKACQTVVNLTGKDLYINNFTFFITTFPRGPYNFGKGYIWEYIGWNNPIAGFMHELLHFQFHHYWRDNPKSAIFKLNDNQFQYLKESLTVVLDEDLVPLIEYPDKGYDMHQKFRKELHGFWKNNHDFNKLVNFGIKILPNYVK